MKTFRKFASVIGHYPLKISKKELGSLRKTALALEQTDDQGLAWSKKNYRSGYTSYASCDRLFEVSTAFERLKKILDKQINHYLKACDLFEWDTLQITHLWVNVMYPGARHAMHVHPQSVVSGTVYLDVPAGGAPIRFEDPRSGLFQCSPMRPIFHEIQPRTGDVILFESWMRHEVPEQQGDLAQRPRISASFNSFFVKNGAI